MSKIVITNVAQTVVKQGALVVPDKVANDPSALTAYLAAHIDSAEILTDPENAQPVGGFTLCDGEYASVAAYELPEEKIINRFTGRCIVYNEAIPSAAYHSDMEIARFLTDTNYELVEWARKGVVVGYGIYKAGFRPAPLTRYSLAKEQKDGAHIDFQKLCVIHRPCDVHTGNYLDEIPILKDWRPPFAVDYISYLADANDKRSTIGFEMMHSDVVDLEHLHNFDASVDRIIEMENSSLICTSCGRKTHPRDVQFGCPPTMQALDGIPLHLVGTGMRCKHCGGEVVRTDDAGRILQIMRREVT